MKFHLRGILGYRHRRMYPHSERIQHQGRTILNPFDNRYLKVIVSDRKPNLASHFDLDNDLAFGNKYVLSVLILLFPNNIQEKCTKLQSKSFANTPRMFESCIQRHRLKDYHCIQKRTHRSQIDNPVVKAASKIHSVYR